MLILSLDASLPNHILADGMPYHAARPTEIRKLAAIIGDGMASATSDFERPAEFGWTLAATPDEILLRCFLISS